MAIETGWYDLCIVNLQRIFYPVAGFSASSSRIEFLVAAVRLEIAGSRAKSPTGTAFAQPLMGRDTDTALVCN